jgi:hypothetical protein
MAAYTRQTYSDNEQITPTKLNAEFVAIAAAVNAIDNANITDAAIANTKLTMCGCPYLVSIGPIKDMTGALTITASIASASVLFDATKVVYVSASCTNNGGGTAPTVDIYSSATGGTILSAPITLTGSNTTYNGTVSVTSSMAQGTVLTVHVTVAALTTLVGLCVTIGMKTQLITY